MSNVLEAVFGGPEGPSRQEREAQKLQAFEAAATRRRQTKERRRQASTAKTLAGANRQGSLFPSDFAPSVPSGLG